MHMFLRKSFFLFLAVTLASFQYLSAQSSYPVGTRVVITNLSPEDSYFESSEDYIGKTGVVIEEELSPSSEGDGWYGGSIDLDDSNENPYFYAVAVELETSGATGKTSTSRNTGNTATVSTIPKGTRVIIADINTEDSYFSTKEDYLGKGGVVKEEKLTTSGIGEGWYSGSIDLDNSEDSPYFYAVALEIETKGSSSIKNEPIKSSGEKATAASIPVGTKVVITELSTEDSYYSDKEDYLGKSGVVSGSSLSTSAEGEGWYSGKIDLDDSENSPYFYAVALNLKTRGPSTVKSAPVKSNEAAATVASIPKGTHVLILDINSEDSYASSKSEHIGKEGIVGDNGLTISSVGKGWYSGGIKLPNTSLGTPYYYAVAVKILPK